MKGERGGFLFLIFILFLIFFAGVGGWGWVDVL